MPYRRLPNTDSARIRALQRANEKGRELPPFKLAYSQSTFQKAKFFLPHFEKLIQQHKQDMQYQVKKNTEYQAIIKKARLYISHFIQVLNFAVIRGELPSITRTFYGLDKNSRSLPSLNTEEDILHWGEKMIKGEAQRTMKGQSPITNPTIAVVKVRYEQFLEAYNYQKTLQKSNTRTYEKIVDLRKEADEIILNVWNEVENHFKDLPDEMKREKSAEYGIIYFYRKNELGKTKLLSIERAGLRHS